MRPVIAAMVIALSAGSVAAQAASLPDSDKSGTGFLSRLLDHPGLQRGQIDLRDVRLDAVAALASMLRGAWLAPPQHDAANAAVTLYRLRLNFQRSSEALVIRDGVACNEIFVATFEGQTSLADGELHFKGVIWPAMFPTERMGLLTPIVGAAVKTAPSTAPADPHLGVFPLHDPNLVLAGLSYALTGSRTKPQLQINPFADVYPGYLRRIAEVCGAD